MSKISHQLKKRLTEMCEIMELPEPHLVVKMGIIKKHKQYRGNIVGEYDKHPSIVSDLRYNGRPMRHDTPLVSEKRKNGIIYIYNGSSPIQTLKHEFLHYLYKIRSDITGIKVKKHGIIERILARYHLHRKGYRYPQIIEEHRVRNMTDKMSINQIKEWFYGDK